MSEIPEIHEIPEMPLLEPIDIKPDHIGTISAVVQALAAVAIAIALWVQL